MTRAFFSRTSLIRDPLTRLVRGPSLWRAAGMAALAVAAMSPLLVSQQVSSDGAAPTALITFTLDFPHSNPEHYSIAVDATGHARYEYSGNVVQDAEEQTYRAEFEVSAGNRQRIFEWAKQAHYFAGTVDSGNRKVAFTGTKILSYQDGPRSNTARYNYSSVEPVRELTALFQNMAGTLEYGRRLAYYHLYQKLALDEELKRMEAQAKSGELSEIQAVAPVLQKIVDDASVINVVRARAKELIEMENGPAGHR
jgi:hypothetical protein